MQKEAEVMLQRCQRAEENARKAAAEVGPLTTHFCPPEFTRSIDQRQDLLQPRWSSLIPHTVRTRLADLVASPLDRILKPVGCCLLNHLGNEME